MEALQYSGCGSATKFRGRASPPHVEVQGESCRIRSLMSTGARGSCTGASITAFNRKRFEGGTGRKLLELRVARAALAVDEDKQQEDVARPDGRSVNMPVPHDVQSTTSTGSTSSNKFAVATDYIQYLPEFLRDDSGPPRWFCPVLENKPPKQAPVLLFLPEVVGTGLGFSLQQENLARLFELRCLRIPLTDRTPFEGLVSFVEETVRKEAKLNPRRPIYLLGESFGGTLALAIASRNPKLDLVLVLVNPSTSFRESPLQPLIPLIEALPPALFPAVPVLLGLATYDPVQWASQIATKIAPSIGSGQISPDSITGALRSLLDVVDAFPKSILPWKLKMLESGARYANSRIRAVKADVLILASEKDQLLPSLEEAKRLKKIIPNSTYRKFPQSGHMLLVEEGFNLASMIKATGFYRQTRSKDVVSNFVRPTKEEIDQAYGTTDILRKLTSPVFFSTGDDGVVVRGVSKIPTSKQPLIFVGNHFFYGLDMGMLWGELMNKLDVLPRGLAHPILFDQTLLEENNDRIEGDRTRLFGGVPVGGKNMFKLLSRGDSIALYPGGAREALHRKVNALWHASL
ncbi:hypothetical protein AXG93_4620s1720 [Marchantia polymorpha subsp. ruderalis]|uniref:Serine aminopeptidase S33 domain-containing protein n=1 Tax=Marchantia polymorpha subsp. ruderalis TaxID=1480154 RepID=A0A176VX70_MARPO|nr:hypothetical protein AXG93_4620s1720 [Marchantia polymorpha subsp. ruderalis]